jgi:hypothetical protein
MVGWFFVFFSPLLVALEFELGLTLAKQVLLALEPPRQSLFYF